MVRCLFSVLFLLGCSREPERAAPAPVASAAPSFTTASAASVNEPAPVVSVAPAASVSSTAPAPAVDVRAIGMHIGGGPNDDANKAPLLASIAPHHDALARCWAALPNRPKLEFGIDADVPAKGGLAKITRPRSTVQDATFIACAVGVFEAIEFLAPKSGIKTTVSTSVRFSPRPA